MIEIKKVNISFSILLIVLISYFAYFVFANVGVIDLINPANETNSTTGDITFHCNATPDADLFITNVTLVIWNESDPVNNVYTVYTTSSNTTNGTVNSTVIRNFTINNIPEEEGYNYTWGCAALDNSSSPTVNWSQTNRTFKVDTSDPVVANVDPVNNSEDTDGTVVFIYNVNDTASGIYNCSLILDSTLDQTDTTITRNANQTFTKTSISAKDSLSWYVSCVDYVGKEGNSTAFDIDTNAGTSSGTNVPNGGYNGREYTGGVLEGLDLTNSLRARDYVSFSLNSKTHKAKLKSIGRSSVVVEVSSSHLISRTINLSQTENFDVDKDGILDLSITLNSISGNRADMTFKEYTQPVAVSTCTESWICSDWSSCTPQGTRTRTCTDVNNCGSTLDKPIESGSCTPTIEDVREAPRWGGGNYIWLVLGIIVLGIVIYLLSRKKRKK